MLVICLIILPYLLAERFGFYGRPRVGGLSLKGYSQTEAARRLAEKVRLLELAPLTLVYGEETWQATPEQIGASVGFKKPLAYAWRIGRRGNIILRWRELLSPPAVNLPLTVSLQPKIIRERFHQFTPEIELDPVNASFDLSTGELNPEKPGRRLDLEQTLPRIAAAIRSQNNRQVAMVFTPVAPRTTQKELLAHRARYLVGTYTTVFDPTAHVRAGNIRRGAQQINGIIVPSNGVFSFNRATGPRDKANGYGEALEIINERLVPGVGGGICQVSSTLYNAVLLAGLPVIERHPHSLPLGYVSLGRDATVYYPRLDLVFKNSTVGNLLVLAEVKDNRITVAVFAETRPEAKTVVRTNTLKVIKFPREFRFDPSVPKGKEQIDKPGQKGYEVLTERIFTLNGREIKREKISLDTYKPQAEIVKIAQPSKKESVVETLSEQD